MGAVQRQERLCSYWAGEFELPVLFFLFVHMLLQLRLAHAQFVVVALQGFMGFDAGLQLLVSGVQFILQGMCLLGQAVAAFGQSFQVLVPRGALPGGQALQSLVELVGFAQTRLQGAL